MPERFGFGRAKNGVEQPYRGRRAFGRSLGRSAHRISWPSLPKGCEAPSGTKGLDLRASLVLWLRADCYPGKPLVGNLLDIPPHHSWLKFKEWADQYGPLFRLNIAGREHYIVSTEKIANDLLRERGTLYSSREQLPAAAQLLGDNMRPLLLHTMVCGTITTTSVERLLIVQQTSGEKVVV